MPPVAPLQVPACFQSNNYWCNLATWTNVAQSHQGAYPAGGPGSTWGRTSMCYLAGKARVSDSSAPFWWGLLPVAGLGDYGPAHEGSYVNEHIELRRWAFDSRNPDDWADRWDAFKDYVEGKLWDIDPRPVAVGWHHTRAIVGSDGTDVFISDSGFGGYQRRSWTDYKQMVVDRLAISTDEEVAKSGFGTGVLWAPMRPEAQRRGALRMYEHRPAKPTDPCSLVFVRGTSTLGRLRWSGGAGHTHGYFYADHCADSGLPPLPEDRVLGHAFEPRAGDELEYTYAVQNIGFAPRDYTVEVALVLDAEATVLSQQTNTVLAVAGRDLVAAKQYAVSSRQSGRLDIGGLDHGVHALRFTLTEGAEVQDVQTYRFRVGTEPRSSLSRAWFLLGGRRQG